MLATLPLALGHAWGVTLEPECQRCGRTVASADYETFERMHYVCFHYEFEHGDVDVDKECGAGGCPSRRVGLRETLADWTDWDMAAFCLGRTLGLYERQNDWWRMKGTFWTENPMGSTLHDMLLALAKAGVLEERREPDQQFRFNRAGGVRLP